MLDSSVRRSRVCSRRAMGSPVRVNEVSIGWYLPLS